MCLQVDSAALALVVERLYPDVARQLTELGVAPIVVASLLLQSCFTVLT